MNRSIGEGSPGQRREQDSKSAVIRKSADVKHSSGGRAGAVVKNRPSPLVATGDDMTDATPQSGLPEFIGSSLLPGPGECDTDIPLRLAHNQLYQSGFSNNLAQDVSAFEYEFDDNSRVAPSQIQVVEMDDNEEDRIRQTLAEFKSNDLIPGSFCKADIDFGIQESSDDEDEDSSSDESMLSVENLITSREERTHHLMLKNAIYDPETLFLLCLGLCLGDYKVDLAIKIIQVLYKVRVTRPEMKAKLRFLELLLAYSYLRLNQ